jgi:formylglycine-generating enzyme required for sulfatase activity
MIPPVPPTILLFCLLFLTASATSAQRPPLPPLPGDANHDGWVNEEDLALVHRDWMKGEVKHLEIDVPGLKYRIGARPLRVVPIPAGTFLMGTTGEGYDGSAEWPRHQVILTRNFFMGETEITQAQWLAVMTEYPANFQPAGNSLGDNYPIYHVSWDEAKSFADLLSAITGETFRLPTEAEWEYCCRGPAASLNRDSIFWFTDVQIEPRFECISNDLYSRYLVYCANSNGGPSQVASRVANGYGIFDMGGNLMEWCVDRFDSTFYTKPEATNPDPMAIDPLFGHRAVRDGSWFGEAWKSRSAYRTSLDPSYDHRSYVGLRVLLEIKK